MNDIMKDAVKIIFLALFVLGLFMGYKTLINLHDPVMKGYQSIKPVNVSWVFHKREKDTTVVITPLQVKLADMFGNRVFTYAQTLREVNQGNKFPSNDLLLAIAATESSFNKKAESSSSVGLLQINYKAHNLEREDLFDVKTNAVHSIKILKDLKRSCKGNMKCTILSYNVGYNGYKKGRYNIDYYNKVIKYMSL